MTTEANDQLLMYNFDLMVEKLHEVIMGLLKKFGVSFKSYEAMDPWVAPNEKSLPRYRNMIVITKDSSFKWNSRKKPERLMFVSKIYPDKPLVAYVVYDLYEYLMPRSKNKEFTVDELMKDFAEIMVDDVYTKWFPACIKIWEHDKEKAFRIPNSVVILD